VTADKSSWFFVFKYFTNSQAEL